MSKIYITFGQAHTHRVNGITFDCDCVAELACTDYTDGREKAFQYFGRKWAFAYMDKPELEFFPRGVISLCPKV